MTAEAHKPKSMILGTGSGIPEKIVTNQDLEKIVDTTDEWIRERSGIERRHILEEGKANSDLSIIAAEQALEDAGLKAKDLDVIIVGTVTPDSPFPSTACRVQAAIGAVKAAAFDISAACSGFLYGIKLADSMIRSGSARYVLVIGAEILTRITDWEDRGTCVLFGDGAGAAVLGPSDGTRGILSSYFKSDGRLAHLLHMEAGGSRYPATHETVDKRMHFIRMEGREVFKHAVRTMSDAATHALEQAGIHPDDLDFLITHQANIRIIEAISKRLKLPKDKVFINIQEYGNTSAASIPIALNQARREGALKDGFRCLLVAFGGGFTWGSALIQF
ncbi:MAG TPA: ketoacyl-ACP synthase III [bacterium]|nr:ketoacyl-ACP synthase III [bacterium]